MENPFSTKCWASGVLPFRFTETGENIDTLLERARRYPTCQIVGPHGSGKSTLLLSLMKRYEQSGKNIQLLFFNDQHRQIPSDITFQENMTLFADGFEQLRFRDQCRLLCWSERKILTLHRPIWFVPVLFRTQPQFSVFVQIVQKLAPDMLTESELQSVYKRSGGNFRSAFFELYDRWENDLKL